LAIGVGGQITLETAQAQIEIPRLEARESSPLTLTCSASPGFIKAGEASTIVAIASDPRHRPLTYSYSASAGTVKSGGDRAVFFSAGAPTGTIEITCRVSDDQGRAAFARATIVINAPAMALPPPEKGIHLPAFPSAAADPKQKDATLIPQHVPVTPPQTASTAQSPSAPLAGAASSSEYSEGYALEAWKKGLKQGQIEYAVPPAMKAQIPASVSVRIHGFQDVAGAQPLLGATGNDTLKVSSYMKVELLAPLNPGEFTIAPLNSDTVQFVPNDGSATWNWNVTPAYEAKNQKLEIRVSLVYKRPDTTLEDILEDKTYTVNVQVQKLTTTMWEDFQKDPIAFIKYVAPGGAGWAALAALVTSLGGFAWWKKKRAKKATRRTPPR
jgi:hypothetical protein